MVEKGLVIIGNREGVEKHFLVPALLGFLGKGGVTSMEAWSSSRRDSAVLKSPSLNAYKMTLSFSLIMLSAGLESA